MKETRPRRRREVKAESLPDGSAVLYDERAQMAYPISATAARIWEMCDGSRTVESMVQELMASYDAASERIEREAEALLRHLAELRLLEPEVGAGP